MRTLLEQFFPVVAPDPFSVDLFTRAFHYILPVFKFHLGGREIGVDGLLSIKPLPKPDCRDGGFRVIGLEFDG